jgi:hypothetical protein
MIPNAYLEIPGLPLPANQVSSRSQSQDEMSERNKERPSNQQRKTPALKDINCKTFMQAA